jgi:FkbM family methyltransferase
VTSKGARQDRINDWVRAVTIRWPKVLRQKDVVALCSRLVHGRTRAQDWRNNQFDLDLDDHIDSRIFLSGHYERENIEALMGLVEGHDLDTFVDVGANIGTFTVNLARLPRIREVHCFEPDPQNRTRLQHHLAINESSGDVTTHGVALSSDDGSGQLFVARGVMERRTGKKNSGMSSLEENTGLSEAVTVDIRRFDGLLSWKGRRVANNIDAEGHEPMVLEGMKDLLRDNYCVLQIEIFPPELAKTTAQLASYGYGPLEMTTKKHTYHFARSDR